MKSADSRSLQSGTSIAATLIARNEERCIVRCLDSIRPWVDRIVLLDTGSTDATVDLARRCGAEVHHLDWTDDFAAARNHGLDLADADWNLVIDADEWLASGGEELRAWCQGSPRLGKICIQNLFDPPPGTPADAPIPYARSWLTRLLPRGVRYQGRVHEQPVSNLPREMLNLHVNHDGYMDAQFAHKRDRNRPLLMLELEQSPDNPYVQYQLGKDAEARHDYADASDWYGLALVGATPDTNWLHGLTVRYLHCLGQAGRGDEALALAEVQMEMWQDSPDFFFVLGNLLLDRAMVDVAHALDQWLPLAESAWERCLEIGERPELEGSVHGRGSHLAQHNLDVMRAQIANLSR